jgi:hypothetical protein
MSALFLWGLHHSPRLVLRIDLTAKLSNVCVDLHAFSSQLASSVRSRGVSFLRFMPSTSSRMCSRDPACTVAALPSLSRAFSLPTRCPTARRLRSTGSSCPTSPRLSIVVRFSFGSVNRYASCYFARLPFFQSAISQFFTVWRARSVFDFLWSSAIRWSGY